MKKTYEDLFDLTASEPLARRYYESLPDALRVRITARAKSIHSVEALKTCAEELADRDG